MGCTLRSFSAGLLHCAFSLAFLLPVAGSAQTYYDSLWHALNQAIDEEAYESGIALYRQASHRPAFRTLDCYRQGRIQHKVGVCHYLLNQEEAAIGFFRDSVLQGWRDCPAVPDTERANTIYNLGISLQYLNQPERAKPYLDSALTIFENAPGYPELELAAKYHGIGNFYHDQYDAFRAGLYYENALSIYRRRPGGQIDQFYLLNDMIAMYMTFQEYARAKEYIEQALALHEDRPGTIHPFDLAMIYLNAGVTELELGMLDNARHYGQTALAMLDPEIDPYFTSIALELLAMVDAEKGNYPSGLQRMQRVLDIRKESAAEGQPDQALASAFENLADIQLRRGMLDEASHALKKAFELVLLAGAFDAQGVPIVNRSKARDDPQLIRLLELKAKVMLAQFEATGAPEPLRYALALHHKIDSVIDQNLVSLQFEGSRLNFLRLKIDYYGQAITDALRAYRILDDPAFLEEAYYFSSKTKAIVLQYQINQAEAVEATADPAIAAEEQALRQRMYALQRQLLEATTGREALLRDYLNAQQDLEAFIRTLESEDPAFYQKRFALIRPPRASALRRELPADAALVEFFEAKDSIYAFWITRADFFVRSVARDSAWRSASTIFLEACQSPDQPMPTKEAFWLRQQLLGDGLHRLKPEINRLCFIPDGRLHALPFEALPAAAESQAGAYLLERYAVSYAYAAGLLLRKGPSEARSNYIGFGTTYSADLNRKLRAEQRFFGPQNLSRLTLSQREIKAGADLFGGQTFLEEAASRQNFLHHAASADILHLSLHGLVDKEDPGRSCLLFDDRHDRFALSALDLYAHPTPANLVLLSACHSASGKILRGEGVQGLSKAFMLSGARNILSSLWSASESASLRITSTFLEGVKEGVPMAAALRSAKLSYLARASPSGRHPFYWANFILIGDLEPRSSMLANPVFPMVAGLLLAGALVLLFFRPWTRQD